MTNPFTKFKTQSAYIDSRPDVPSLCKISFHGNLLNCIIGHYIYSWTLFVLFYFICSTFNRWQSHLSRLDTPAITHILWGSSDTPSVARASNEWPHSNTKTTFEILVAEKTVARNGSGSLNPLAHVKCALHPPFLLILLWVPGHLVAWKEG